MLDGLVKAIAKKDEFSFIMIYQRALNELYDGDTEKLEEDILKKLGGKNVKSERKEIEAQKN